MLFMEDTAENFVLEEIEKIVRERWRFIERTTRYGWLTACSRGPSISREEATTLSSLAAKIGYDSCKEAFRQIREACRDSHPFYVTGIAMAILDEMYTIVIIRKRGRESKWRSISLRDFPPTIFTISNDIF